MSKINKSQKMREIFENNEDITIKEIADEVEVRYAFAYQVIRRYCDKNELEMPTENTENTKKERIIELYEEGYSIADCSKEVDTNYSYAWKVVDDYRKSKES